MLCLCVVNTQLTVFLEQTRLQILQMEQTRLQMEQTRLQMEQTRLQMTRVK